MDSSDSSKLQFLQEQYEQRVRNLFALVHSTSEDLRADDIIMAMKSDPVTQPYAQQRAREVWESALEREREATITGLMNDLAEAKQTIRDLESQLANSQRAVVSAEDKVRMEIAKADELTREAEKIHQKASASTLSFEENIRKRESEAFMQLSKARSDYENLKADFDKLEADYERKSQELEATYQELAECTSAIHSLQQEVETLTAKLDRQQDLQKFHEKMSFEYQEADAAMQERSTAMSVELARLKAELRESHQQIQRLEGRLISQNEAFQKQQDALNRKYTETQSATEQRYETELGTLREKASAYRQKLQDAELQLQESQRSVDNIRERWQQEVLTLRSEHEQTRSSLEKQREKVDRSYQQREEDLRKQYEAQVEALHSHYKQLVLDKSQDFEGELHTEREQWKGREQTMREKLREVEEDLRENYVSIAEHELELQEKENALEQTIKRAREDADEQWTRRLKEETEKISRECTAQIEHLAAKLRQCEEDRDSCSLSRRKADEELQLALQLSERLKATLAQSHADLAALQKAHSATDHDLLKVTKELEESAKAIESLRSSETFLHEAISQSKQENRQLSDQLREQELAHRTKLKEEKTSHREELRTVESQADRFKAEIDQLALELAASRSTIEQLETERDRVLRDKEHHELRTQETIRSVKAEEAERSNSHLRVHNEVKGKLTTIETELADAQAELEALKNAYLQLQAEKAEVDQQLLSADAARTDLESALKVAGRQSKEQRTKYDASIRSLKGTITQYAKIIRKLKTSYRNQLARLQTDVLQCLQDFSKSLSSLSSRCLMGVDDRMLTIQRKYQTAVIEYQEHAESLQRRMEKAKADSHTWMKSLETDHNDELSRLSDMTKELTIRVRSVEDERSTLAFQLEKTRQELLKKEEVRENQTREWAQMQEVVRRLQLENASLREKAKVDTEARMKALESEYAKEIQRMALENDRARVLSEESLSQLKSEVESLQSAHTDETTRLMTMFKQKLAEKDTALESVRNACNEEVARLRQELYAVRRKKESVLESEVEGLVANLQRQQSSKDVSMRSPGTFTAQERDVEEYRKDSRMYRGTEGRFDTRLSLSQLTPNRK